MLIISSPAPAFSFLTSASFSTITSSSPFPASSSLTLPFIFIVSLPSPAFRLARLAPFSMFIISLPLFASKLANLPSFSVILSLFAVPATFTLLANTSTSSMPSLPKFLSFRLIWLSFAFCMFMVWFLEPLAIFSPCRFRSALSAWIFKVALSNTPLGSP